MKSFIKDVFVDLHLYLQHVDVSIKQSPVWLLSHSMYVTHSTLISQQIIADFNSLLTPDFREITPVLKDQPWI